jgi:hypothetical protein
MFGTVTCQGILKRVISEDLHTFWAQFKYVFAAAWSRATKRFRPRIVRARSAGSPTQAAKQHRAACKGSDRRGRGDARAHSEIIAHARTPACSVTRTRERRPLARPVGTARPLSIPSRRRCNVSDPGSPVQWTKAKLEKPFAANIPHVQMCKLFPKRRTGALISMLEYSRPLYHWGTREDLIC